MSEEFKIIHKKIILIWLLVLTTVLFFVLISCDNIKFVTKYYVKFDATDDNTDDQTSDPGTLWSNSNTVAAFWGLPGIKFKNWRPNIHIKASTDNGTLANRVWEPDPNFEPDPYSLFEYSQILYYDSNYLGASIDPKVDATVDNNILMSLAFEQKIYKRSWYELNKYDVSYDISAQAVVITLNTENSNYLVLKNGARIAIFATQRPSQWGEKNDYTIIDAIPGENSMQKSSNYSTIKDNTTDRSVTRDLGYITYNGGVLEVTDDLWSGHWFKGMKIESEKITIYMPKFIDGNTAKSYWDSVDSEPLKPFMLFWLAIQQ